METLLKRRTYNEQNKAFSNSFDFEVLFHNLNKEAQEVGRPFLFQLLHLLHLSPLSHSHLLHHFMMQKV
jgi:hypothetical protein